MAENDPLFQDKVRNAFKNAKEDINRVDNEILSLKSELNEIKSNISGLKEELSKIIPFLEKLSINKPSIGVVSSNGNEGVLSKQASKQALKHSTIEQLEQSKDLQEGIKSQFQSLTRKEFLTFLTIYQLEEELEIVRFLDISKRLNLSEGCIRAYVTKLFEKNIPIIKKKINNRIVNLSLLPEFRKLGLKKALTSMYYDLDPLQRNLSDQF
ncbi:MAG: hypothetical protein CMH62_02835 [Nanoarchaeota archaeon]|nr:hypothetical protein [Nanoarchaeota archaeon]|tara:strand:- start:141 stop:773 length:633 start_codon:yes stop_codon:yes gene_type:complete